MAGGARPSGLVPLPLRRGFALEIYEVFIGGIPHHMQLDVETAERIGAKPVADTAAVPNKARRGKVKARVASTDPAE